MLDVARRLQLTVQRHMATEIDILTSLKAAADVATRRAVRLSWMALAAGALGLAGHIIAGALGYPAPWTSWLLAIVLTANPAVYLASQRWQTFHAAHLYFRITSVATLVASIGLVIQRWHR
jgi:hypothetical protein